MSDFLGYHSQFFKVDQSIDNGVIAEMDKGEILLNQREKWKLKKEKRKGEINLNIYDVVQ